MGVVKRAAVVPIGPLDERANAAMRRADHLHVDRRVAVHIARDRPSALATRKWWAHRPHSDWELHLSVGTPVPSTVAAEVRTMISAGFDEVVVVIGFVASSTPERRLEHDHTAECICTAVGRITGAASILVPVGDRCRRSP